MVLALLQFGHLLSQHPESLVQPDISVNSLYRPSGNPTESAIRTPFLAPQPALHYIFLGRIVGTPKILALVIVSPFHQKSLRTNRRLVRIVIDQPVGGLGINPSLIRSHLDGFKIIHPGGNPASALGDL